MNIDLTKLIVPIRSFAFLALMLTTAAAVLAQAGGLKGKVRTNSGQGIAGAVVTITYGGKDVKSGRSDPSGIFLINGIEPGTYTLRVEARGYASGALFGVEIKNKVKDLGDKLFLTVDQGSQVILRGSVFFKEGTSVTRAKVELERARSDGSFERVGSTETNVSGEFVFRQPPGAATYRVTAKYKGVTAVKEVSVDNPAVYRVAVSLDLSREDR
jgi:hypothetical protein